MLKAALAWGVARLREPSTWAGIAALVGSMSFLPGAATDATLVTIAGTAICGALAVVIPGK